MQARRRNFGERFSPARAEYRKFGRGGSSRRRNQQNSPPPPLNVPARPIRHRAEVLWEAGRLAAEYLASKGLLPSNPASSTEKWWLNGGDEDVDRMSAFSRLGRRQIDADDGGFKRKRVRRRKNRGDVQRRPGSDWIVDRRSLSEDSDRGDDSMDRRKAIRSALDEASEKSDSDRGNAVESSEPRVFQGPAKPNPNEESDDGEEIGSENAEIENRDIENELGEEEIKEISDAAAEIEKESKMDEEQCNLPSTSFKTCDLNSTEAPETISCDPITAAGESLEGETTFPALFQQKQEPPVIIDLEDESKIEPARQSLEILPGIPDGYGIEISEFLGTEGIAGDTLFMNMGDIPMNFMDVWDQGPSEYGKFF